MNQAPAYPDDAPPDAELDGTPQPYDGDPRRLASRSKRSSTWTIVPVLAIVAGGAAFFYWWSQRALVPPSPLAVPSVEPALPRATSPTDAAPAIRHPLESEVSSTPTPLPSLQESDATVLGALAGIGGGDALERIVQREDIVRRIVATVDNLPRKKVAQRLLPVKPAPGWLVTDAAGNSIAIGAGNAARYAPYMRVVEAVDAKLLAALYLRFYPLFQQAYRDLGYPDGYFNDRLVEAIDDLLATPDLRSPAKLTQPKVFYEYADPDLEQRSAGQKIMLRIGANNAVLVKAKLRAFRKEVAKPGAKP